jgi:hypothetical protein
MRKGRGRPSEDLTEYEKAKAKESIMNEKTITITLRVGPEHSNLPAHLELTDLKASAVLPLLRIIVRERRPVVQWDSPGTGQEPYNS